jgi:hypothetical protein
MDFGASCSGVLRQRWLMYTITLPVLYGIVWLPVWTAFLLGNVLKDGVLDGVLTSVGEGVRLVAWTCLFMSPLVLVQKATYRGTWCRVCA